MLQTIENVEVVRFNHPELAGCTFLRVKSDNWCLELEGEWSRLAPVHRLQVLEVDFLERLYRFGKRVEWYNAQNFLAAIIPFIYRQTTHGIVRLLERVFFLELGPYYVGSEASGGFQQQPKLELTVQLKPNSPTSATIGLAYFTEDSERLWYDTRGLGTDKGVEHLFTAFLERIKTPCKFRPKGDALIDDDAMLELIERGLAFGLDYLKQADELRSQKLRLTSQVFLSEVNWLYPAPEALQRYETRFLDHDRQEAIVTSPLNYSQC